MRSTSEKEGGNSNFAEHLVQGRIRPAHFLRLQINLANPYRAELSRAAGLLPEPGPSALPPRKQGEDPTLSLNWEDQRRPPTVC